MRNVIRITGKYEAEYEADKKNAAIRIFQLVYYVFIKST